MTEFWMELRPVDGYKVKAEGVITEFDRKVLLKLYQPLMGANALSLYFSLLEEVEENKLWSKAKPHSQLLTSLGISLKAFFEARLKLEGLGLVRSYKKAGLEDQTFVYELLAPLSPRQFFEDGLLNIYLFSQVGHKRYQELQQLFVDQKFDSTGYSDVTRNFQDVFEPFRGGDKTPEIPVEAEFIEAKAATEIQLDSKEFDWTYFYELLSPNMLSREQITEPVKDTILKMHAIYQVEESDIPSFLYRSLDARGVIQLEQLRKIIRESYQLKHHNLPKLSTKQRVESTQAETQPKPEVNDEEALQVYLESVTPFQLLIDIADGAEPAETDLRVIEEVMTKQNLPQPVMNVLIEYVLLRLDGKISRNYMMTIAAHWKRKNVKTAKEAMELALAEHEKYKRLQEEPEEKRKFNRASQFSSKKRTEVLPDWFNKEETEPAKSELSDREKEALEDQVKRIKKQLKR
ncbi:replication initiation and membrane attachment family protein [Listeria valentina]|uniref:replication initiation and membrane attachment family protein n=1 Tax=Listeria valentina TaxID=2705293 RepID=UPI001431A956|nr:DnaD domain protein [Listeria valentina]